MTGFDPASGLYEQFAGFNRLEPLDVAAYADHAMPIDVVIGRERTQGAQVVKQADVVALIALLLWIATRPMTAEYGGKPS